MQHDIELEYVLLKSNETRSCPVCGAYEFEPSKIEAAMAHLSNEHLMELDSSAFVQDHLEAFFKLNRTGQILMSTKKTMSKRYGIADQRSLRQLAEEMLDSSLLTSP